MNKPTLLILTDCMVVGGLEKLVCEAIHALHEQYDITVQTLFGDVHETVREQIRDEAKLITASHSPKLNLFINLPVIGGWVLNRLVRERYDYLVVLRPALIMAGYSKIAKKTMMWYVEDNDMKYANVSSLSFKQRINKIRINKGYCKLDATWVVNDEVQKAIAQAFPKATIVAIANPIDVESVREKSQVAVETLFPNQEEIKFVMVARLCYNKGVYRVLQAAKDLDRKVRFIVVGDGEDRAAMETFCKENGMEESVAFVGMQANPYPYILQADALICPSHHESFGIVMLEAMVLGKNIITSATVGGKYLTQNGKIGILTENTDEGLAWGIGQFLADPGKYKKEGQALQKYAETFDTSVFKQKLLDALEK